MGLPSKFDVVIPLTISELSFFLLKNSSRYLYSAGGTQIIPNIKKSLYPNLDLLVSLSKIDEMRFINYKKESDTLLIGSLTTISEIINSPIIKKVFPSLAIAGKLIAAPPLQNRATIGGNISLDTRCLYYNQSANWRSSRKPCYKLGGNVCNALPGSKKCFAVFSADLPPMLISVDAELEIFNGETFRTIPLKDFYTGDGTKPNILKTNEVVTQLILKNISTKISFYEKFRLRNSIDYPLSGVAVGYSKDNPSNMRIVLNAVDSQPITIDITNFSKDRLGKITSIIEKQPKPIANMPSTPEHRKLLSTTLFQKIIDNFGVTNG